MFVAFKHSILEILGDGFCVEVVFGAVDGERLVRDGWFVFGPPSWGDLRVALGVFPIVGWVIFAY